MAGDFTAQQVAAATKPIQSGEQGKTLNLLPTWLGGDVDYGAAVAKYIGGDKAADVIPAYSNVRGGASTVNSILPSIVGTPVSQPSNGSSTGSAGGSNPVDTATITSPTQSAAYGQAYSTLQDAINRANSQLGIAQGNINNQYGVSLNELNSAKDAAQQQYGTSTTQNQQQLRTNENTIADQASQGLRGLLRTLGAYGAGGSSDARYVAPQAVSQQASTQRSGADQTFAQNQQGLDTNWNNYLGQEKNSQAQLDDWKTQQLNQAQASALSTKQTLLQKLADLQTAGSGAAQNYLDQANALSSQIDQLGAVNPTYTGTTPTYTAPTLSSYINNANTATGVAPTTTADTVSPYLSLLLGQQKKDNNGLGF